MLRLRIPNGVQSPVSFEISFLKVVSNLGSDVSITRRKSGQKFRYPVCPSNCLIPF